MKKIKFYNTKEKYGFLSNFYKCDDLIIDNVKCPTVSFLFGYARDCIYKGGQHSNNNTGIKMWLNTKMIIG